MADRRKAASLRLVALLTTMLVLAPSLFAALHASAYSGTRVRPETVELCEAAAHRSHDCPLCTDLARCGSDLPASAPRAALVHTVFDRAAPLALPQHALPLPDASAAPRAPPTELS